MDIDKIMNLIAEDLQINAMPFKQYCYEVKATHQIIRKHLTEQLLIHTVVVPKGTLSNLDEAIKKAKPNMDKIKDVDEHLDSIR